MPSGSPSNPQLTKETARILAVVKQGLNERPTSRPVDRDLLLETIGRIGILQLDSVSAVARSHYLVMLSRVGMYDPALLDSLLYPDRELFEQWAHAACLIPSAYFQYFAPLIRSRRGHPHRKMHRLGRAGDRILAKVLSRVKAEGGLRSRDFDDPRERGGKWWDWKPAKYALEILFERGHLMVDRRINFQRVYNLPARILPRTPGTAKRTLSDWRTWATVKSLSCLGVGTSSNVADYFRQDRLLVEAELERLVQDGTIVKCDVGGWSDSGYILASDLGLVRQIETRQVPLRLTALLSPFDNLIWDRTRTRELFDFEYKTQLYVAVSERTDQSGYYVMPIIHDGRLIGRVDPRMNRRSNVLDVRSVTLEDGVKSSDRLIIGLSSALVELARFNQGTDISVGRMHPKALRSGLVRTIRERLRQASRPRACPNH